MARKRRQSPLEDLIDIAAILPYWLSALLALISYFFFHHYATTDVIMASAHSSNLPLNMGAMIFRGMSVGLQYIVPFALGLGALTSFLKAFRGRSLAKDYVGQSLVRNAAQRLQAPSDQCAQKELKPTDDLSWQDFELLVGQAFRQRGYRVIDGGDAGADGGVDVHLKKDGKVFFVQCKHWKAQRVGVALVRELFGVISAAKVAGGFIVTSGTYTEEAIAFAKDLDIELIDGAHLDALLRKAATPDYQSKAPVAVPSCPACSSDMIKRTAQRGDNKGKTFWGCSRFPRCRGIRNI